MDPIIKLSKYQGKASLNDEELEGICEIKRMNEEYLKSGKGSKALRAFLAEAGDDDELLLRFLKGRKHRPKHAWETIKRHGEVRFDDYPEVFPPTFPNELLPLIDNLIVGALKARDSKGRRILYFNANEWDTGKYPIAVITALTAFCIERLLLDEDCLNNGVVFIQENSEIGWKHAREYSLSAMLRYLNVFYFAYPLKVKAVFFVNFPYFLSFLYSMLKPFLPKKFKERFLVTSSGKSFDDVHRLLSPDILPKCLGGKLEAHEAVDTELFNFH